jgi:hypothetical protein
MKTSKKVINLIKAIAEEAENERQTKNRKAVMRLYEIIKLSDTIRRNPDKDHSRTIKELDSSLIVNINKTYAPRNTAEFNSKLMDDIDNMVIYMSEDPSVSEYIKKFGFKF